MIKSPNIFLTGAAGCVGHYALQILAQHPDWHIFAFVKRPDNIQLPVKTMPNVTVVQGDLLRLHEVKDYIQQSDAIVHLAAGWSGQAAYDLNVTETLHLFSLADPARCRQIIYFSTASIMNEKNDLLPAAARGSDYIASKYQLFQRLPESPIHDRITVIFPTAVIGGSPRHPYSHIGRGLQQAKSWIKYARFISLDAGFHFIHAEDLAKVTAHVLEKSFQGEFSGDRRDAINRVSTGVSQKIVLGQPYITLAEALRQVADAYDYSVPFQCPLPTALLMALVKHFKSDMTEWDRFCVDHRHFRYLNTTPQDLGVESRFVRLQDCVRDLIKNQV